MLKMFQGESLKRLLQGAAAGAVIAMALGFGFGGWQLQSKALKMANDKVAIAVVAALAPICVANFQRGADAKAQLVALKATDSWKQDTFVKDGGWADFPGSGPNRAVAEDCAKMLNELK
ncbi:MAG: hypothetical protein Q7S50_04540 [bacterium]|nr:hypothetical protein [bacterium]